MYFNIMNTFFLYKKGNHYLLDNNYIGGNDLMENKKWYSGKYDRVFKEVMLN